MLWRRKKDRYVNKRPFIGYPFLSPLDMPYVIKLTSQFFNLNQSNKKNERNICYFKIKNYFCTRNSGCSSAR